MDAERFVRSCPRHGLPLSPGLRCPAPRPHDVSLWAIKDTRSGIVVGCGHVEHGGHLVPGFLDPSLKIEKPTTCPRGHVGRWYRRADSGRYRCGACHCAATRRSMAKAARVAA